MESGFTLEKFFLPPWMGLLLLLPVFVWLICGLIDHYRWRNKPFIPATVESSTWRRLYEWIVMHPVPVILGSWLVILICWSINTY